MEYSENKQNIEIEFTSMVNETKTDMPLEDEREQTTHTSHDLIYKISDSPPVHLIIFFGLQQALVALFFAVILSQLVADTVCAAQEEEIKTRLLSSTLLMNGVTTLLMNLVGVRIPVFQGASPDYVAPLLAIQNIDKDRCNFDKRQIFNITSNKTVELAIDKEQKIMEFIQELQGGLIASGCIHCLIGATGLAGVLLRFIGPITIVPTILLVAISMTKSVTDFSEVHWGISMMTATLAILFSLYLEHHKMPIPIWTKKKSCHVIRYPLHNVLAILFALVAGWIVCGIMTAAGSFDHAKNSTIKEFYARTDSRSYLIVQAPWFYFPYPGQFGKIGFNAGAFLGFVIATFTSILDSIGDYYACAATCRVPPPPAHGVNRGIVVEGICTSLSGALGCGLATTTYGANIGAIGLTKVASRSVFICAAVIYIVFGVVGKVSAVFIAIPKPVLGGTLIAMVGVFMGVILSNLRSVNLTSNRNLSIIGTALLMGLMMPKWIANNPDSISTGNDEADYVIKMVLGNPNLMAGVTSCFLDNTIPGNLTDRGIAAWRIKDETALSSNIYVEGYEVYKPVFVPRRIRATRIMNYIPFMPNVKTEK